MAENVRWRMSGSGSSNWLWNGSSSQSAKPVYSFIRITGYFQIQDCKFAWVYVTDTKNNYFITWLLVGLLLSWDFIFVRMILPLLIPTKSFSRYCQYLVIKSKNWYGFSFSVLPPSFIFVFHWHVKKCVCFSLLVTKLSFLPPNKLFCYIKQGRVGVGFSFYFDTV